MDKRKRIYTKAILIQASTWEHASRKRSVGITICNGVYIGVKLSWYDDKIIPNKRIGRGAKHYSGLSSDVKPISKVLVGSTFTEEDTGKKFQYGASGWFFTGSILSDESGNAINIANPSFVNLSDNSGRAAANSIFGDVIVGTKKPSLSYQYNYGYRDRDFTVVEANGGAVSSSNSQIYLNTGTNAAGSCSAESQSILIMVLYESLSLSGWQKKRSLFSHFDIRSSKGYNKTCQKIVLQRRLTQTSQV